MTDRTIVLVAYQGISMLDLVGPADVFAGVNRVTGSPRYRLLVASADGRPLTGDSGLRLEADARLSSVTGRVGTLLIAGGTDPGAMRSNDRGAEVRRMDHPAPRVGG